MQALIARLRRIRRGKQDGFSVIEMLLVFTILAIAMLPLASVQFQSRRQVTEAQRQSQAMQIALGQIERARMVGFENAVGDTLNEPPFLATAAVVADPANPFLQEIQVTVRWMYGSDERTVTVAGKQAAR